MAFRFRPVFGNGNLSPFFYQLYKFYLRTVKYRYEFVYCHVAVSSVKLAANVQAACVSGDFKKRELLGKNKYTQKSSTSGKNNLSHCASRRLEEVHGKSNLCLDP